MATGIDVNVLEEEAEVGVYYFIPRAAELFAFEDDVTELGVASIRMFPNLAGINMEIASAFYYIHMELNGRGN